MLIDITQLKVILAGLLNKFGSSTSTPAAAYNPSYLGVTIEYNITESGLYALASELYTSVLPDRSGEVVYGSITQLALTNLLLECEQKGLPKQDIANKIIEVLEKGK